MTKSSVFVNMALNEHLNYTKRKIDQHVAEVTSYVMRGSQELK